MAYLPLVNIVPQFFDSLGDPLVGGTLNAYVAGTSTPTNMYSDNIGTVAGTSVTLDSRGEPTTIKLIWVDTDVSYKFVLKDSNGTTIWTEDNIQVTSIGNGSVTADKLASSSVTASKIATDAVTTTKIQDDAVTSEKIADNAITASQMKNSGYELGLRNKIINGDMFISQRGTSFSSANGFTLDRWHYTSNGAAAATVTQNSDVPSNSVFQKSLRVAITTADTSIAAGDYSVIKQAIEGSDVYDLIGRTFVLSFWVRSTKTGTHCVSFRNLAVDRSYVLEYTVNATNTWEFKTVTVTDGLTSAGTWSWSASGALLVTWALASGSTYQTTAGAWQSGNYIATSNQVNCLDSTSNIFAITGAQLELGTSNTPFEYSPYANKLSLCQRYYEIGDSVIVTTSLYYWSRAFAVTKRVDATMSATYNTGTGATLYGDNTGFRQITTHSASAEANWVASAEFSLTGA